MTCHPVGLVEAARSISETGLTVTGIDQIHSGHRVVDIDREVGTTAPGCRQGLQLVVVGRSVTPPFLRPLVPHGQQHPIVRGRHRETGQHHHGAGSGHGPLEAGGRGIHVPGGAADQSVGIFQLHGHPLVDPRMTGPFCRVDRGDLWFAGGPPAELPVGAEYVAAQIQGRPAAQPARPPGIGVGRRQVSSVMSTPRISPNSPDTTATLTIRWPAARAGWIIACSAIRAAPRIPTRSGSMRGGPFRSAWWCEPLARHPGRAGSGRIYRSPG